LILETIAHYLKHMHGGVSMLRIEEFAMCGLRNLSMSLASSSRGAVAALVSFCIHTRLSLQENKMAGVIENYSKFEAHAVVRLFQTEGVSEIHRSLVSVYGQNVFSQ
jgi:hypothetical protein